MFFRQRASQNWLSRLMVFSMIFGLSTSHAAGVSAAAGVPVNYGIYDPDGLFLSSNRIAVDHIFERWTEYDVSRVTRAQASAADRNRWLMITLEPWMQRGDTENLLRGIAAGRYDRFINLSCAHIGFLNVPLFIRWGHEMEDPTGRYPWADADPDGYVNAYRHFVSRCRELAPKALFVWSPKGKPGLNPYYPGGAYVDYVGVSLYGLEAWDLDHKGRPVLFNEAFRDIYGAVSRFGHPVMIAELGVSGGAEYRFQWMKELDRAGERFPLVRTVVYFNARDPAPWPSPYGYPDWRTNEQSFPPSDRSAESGH